MRVCQQVVCEQDRLGGLQVGLARHDRVRMCRRLVGQRRHHIEHTVGHPAHPVAQPHPEQSGDLVVARAPGPQPAAEVGADPVDESAFQGPVHVLVGYQRSEAAVGDVGAEAVQADEQAVALVVGEQTGPVQNARVRLGRGHVVGRQHPVEVRRLAQCRKGLRRPTVEPTAP